LRNMPAHGYGGILCKGCGRNYPEVPWIIEQTPIN